MSNEEWEQSLKEAPADRELRLVYSDWLEEQGNLRDAQIWRQLMQELELYLVRSKNGNWYGGNKRFIPTIGKAKLYRNISGARKVITDTICRGGIPKEGSPDLVKLTVFGMEVLDETERIEKFKKNKLKKEQMLKQIREEAALREAQWNLAEAQARLDLLQKQILK